MKEEDGMRKEEEKAEKSKRKGGATPSTLGVDKGEEGVKDVKHREALEFSSRSEAM